MLSKNSHNMIAGLLFFVFSCSVYARGLSIHGIEYRDDEIFYYKSTQQMLADQNYLSPTYFDEDRFQKPILFYWLIMISYSVFGVSWFSARIVSVIFAGLSIAVTWLIGKELFDKRVATLGSLILMTVPLFFRHAKNAVPDMALNFFIVLSFYCLLKFIQEPQRRIYPFIFFLSCALGFMIKGIAALVFPVGGLLLYALLSKRVHLLKDINLALGLLVFCAVVLPWFLYMVNVHGKAYLNFMLVGETQNRLLGGSSQNGFINVITNFGKHSLFYLRVIFSYFLPWNLFFLGALPLAVKKLKQEHQNVQPFLYLFTWFFLVFIIFSFMHVVISHYMLILSTPFVLIASFYLLQERSIGRFSQKMINAVNQSYILFWISLGTFAFCLLVVFFVGLNKGWLLVIAACYGIVLRYILKHPNPMKAPLALALLMIFVFSQTTLMSKAGVTAHSTLQGFADTINEQSNDRTIISVGSHDLHEKEFQVYFDQKVQKAAASVDHDTKARLLNLLSSNKQVLCLITEKDFNNLLGDYRKAPLEILQEDYLIRKRMRLDKGFLKALFTLDQKGVLSYLKEKVILFKKKENV